MEDLIKKKFWTIWDLTQKDEQYAQMMDKNAILERKYDKVLQGLSYEHQDIIQDFLMSCEAMSDRMLEVACTLMRFPDEK